MSIRIGVIGGGTFGRNPLLAFRQLEHGGRAVLAGLADTNPELLRQRKEEFGIPVYEDHRRMLDEIETDAVSIATPDHLHREIALEALRRGKHVLVEKPLDLTEAGCRELIDLAEKNGRLLQVDFHKRFDPDHRAMAEAVRRGGLGDILYGHAHMEDRVEVPTRWFPGWAANSSPAWFLGIHFFDLVNWMLGDRPARVFATGQRGRLPGMEAETWNAIQTHVTYARGAAVTFQCSWVLPDEFEAIVNQGVRLVGSQGCWEVDSQDRGTASCLAGEGMRTHNNHFLRERADKSGQITREGYGIDSIADFVENLEFLAAGHSLEDLRGKYPSGQDAMEATRVAAAAHASLESGEPVDLSPPSGHAGESRP